MSLNKKLRDIAEVLPPLPKMLPNGKPFTIVSDRMQVRGEKILKENPDAVVDGKPVDPNKLYMRVKRELVYENHSKKLLDIKRRFGIEGIRSYVSLCYTWNKMEIPEGVFEGVS